jgi:putative restriction endonuclease
MADKPAMEKYIHEFTHLHTDRTGGWTDATRGQAPHKPLLLLTIIDLFAQGQISTNLIEITPELCDLFATYWSRVMPSGHRGNLVLPFFHLGSSRFWHRVAQPGQETIINAIGTVSSLKKLNQLILGARLDDELFELLQSPNARDVLRTAIIQIYFAEDLQTVLVAQSEMNLQTFLYSQHLIQLARKHIKESPTDEESIQKNVRDQGFRKAIVYLYDHRCAFCGVRMLTSDGHSAVDAAHIIPWNICQNNDPHNGMALCRLCHWTFDEGLLGVSEKYWIILSEEIRGSHNVPGHLQTLESRPIIGPAERELWPDVEAIGWHREKIFRKV